MQTYAQELINFIDKSPSAFQCCENVIARLEKNGFSRLIANSPWHLEKGGRYYITKNSSAIIAFIYSGACEKGFSIAAAHMDSPCIAIKPNAEVHCEGGYLRLNTEVYGGAVLSSWLDRPLAICGRIMLKGENPLSPVERLINIKKPLLIIPNLAIHLNREINNGYKYSKQKDMSPIATVINNTLEKDNLLIHTICKQTGIEPSTILDFELYLYEYEKGCITGLNNEFISASRLDDQMMCFSILNGFLGSADYGCDKTRLIYFSDNEEIGSETAQGAKSSFLKDTIQRICLDSTSKEAYYVSIENSVIISADLAHGLHPNHMDKSDITSRPILGSGICLKYSATQKYSTNSICGAIFSALCQKAGVKMQKFANNSDIAGGSTIGPMLGSSFSIPVADIGAPILSMHSIRELASVSDNYDCLKLFSEFFRL